MQIPHLQSSIELGLEREGFNNLSFWGDDDLSVAEICRLAGIPNKMIRVSTAGKLRAGCFDHLYPSDPYPHLTLEFEERPTDAYLGSLRRCSGNRF